MLQILSHTPPWVFFLFAGLLTFGLLQTKTRSVKAFQAYLLPAGMILLSLAGVQSSFGMNVVPIVLWAVGLAVVAFACSRFVPLEGVAYDAEHKAFFLPGSWLPLVVIMAIFFTKYAVAVMRALDVGLVDSPAIAALLSLAYGGFSGYFAARSIDERDDARVLRAQPVERFQAGPIRNWHRLACLAPAVPCTCGQRHGRRCFLSSSREEKRQDPLDILLCRRSAIASLSESDK